MRESIKATLIGSANTGKSAFLNRFVKNEFSFTYTFTVGIDFEHKAFQTSDEYKWQLWDIAGQERFRSISTAYSRNASTVLIFVDAARPTESIRESASFNGIPGDAICAVIFTKSDHKEAFDLTNERVCLSYVTDVQTILNIPTTQFKTTSPYFITSAKSGTGINEAMEAMETAVLSLALEAKKTKQTPKTQKSWWERTFSSSDDKQEKLPKQNTITVPSFGESGSRTLFQHPPPKKHKEEKSPEINITFDKLGF